MYLTVSSLQRLPTMYEDLHISELQHRIAAFEDALAFKELFRRFQPGLKKFAFSISHSTEEAEEAVDDVFMRVWMKRKTLDHIHNLKLYLYIATRNFSINQLKSHRQFQPLQIEQLRTEIEAISADPQQLMMSRELENRLLEAVNSLPPQCKTIFKLVKEDGLKQKEVAELLHLQPKTVENQIAIALKKIAMVLSDYQQEHMIDIAPGRPKKA
ncbi:MAG TPA: RNA polymerase sigma-70 factor [Phnomibacter sp.]|nr:RNA polymerase sigma-70 factor [Phnomibacter sp.]